MDEELRGLERRAAGGDEEARRGLVQALVRAQRVDDAAWAATGFSVRPDLFARLGGMPVPQAAAALEDLGALDPARLRARFPRDADGALAKEAVLARFPRQRWDEPRTLMAVLRGGRLCVGLVADHGPEAPRWTWDARLGGAIVAVVPGPGGAILAATAAGEVLAEEPGGSRRALARGPGPVLALGCGPRGEVAWVTPEAAHLVGPAGGPARRVSLPFPALVAALDRRLELLAVSDGRALAAVELASGAVLWRQEDARLAEPAAVRVVSDLAFSAQGEHLAQAGGAVVVRGARTGRPEGVPVLPGRATLEWSDNASTMGLGRDEGVDEQGADARRVAWVGARRLATLGRELCVWTLGPHARPGEWRTSYGEDVTSRRRAHHTPDAEKRADALLESSQDGAWLLALVEGAPRLLESQGLLEVWHWAQVRGVLSGACDVGRCVLGLETGELRVLPLGE